MVNLIFKYRQFFPIIMRDFFEYGVPYLQEDRMTPEITEFILKGQNAFLTLERELDKEELIIIGSILEEVQTLNCIYHKDKESLAYFISLLYTIFYSIPTLISRRLTTYYSHPIFKPEKSYKIDSKKRETKEINAYARQREKYDSLNDQFNSDREKKINRAEAINKLRKYLLVNKLVLKGTLKNSKVTFGSEINSLLKVVIPQMKNIKSSKVLEGKLKEIYQQNIKVAIV